MSKLYVFDYNNYYNRIIKKESSLASYGTPKYSLDSTNFNYNDGVTTSHITNYDGVGDYCVVCNDQGAISSRWFILENPRTRGNQHRMDLRRDIIADYYDNIIVAPMIVSRAMITDTFNPLLYNSENLSLNQIKKREIALLPTRGNRAYWYVLYLANNAGDKSGTITLSNQPYDIPINTTIENSIYKQQTYHKVDNVSFELCWFPDMHWYITPGMRVNRTVYDTIDSTDVVQNAGVLYKGSDGYEALWIVEDEAHSLTQMETALTGTYATMRADLLVDKGITEVWPGTTSDLNNILAANGKIVKSSDNHYYRIKVTDNSTSYKDYFKETDSTVAYVANRITNVAGLEIWGDFGNQALEYQYSERTVSVTYEKLSDDVTLTWKIDLSHYNNPNAEYRVVYIPANNQNVQIYWPNVQPDQSIIWTTMYTDCYENLNKAILDAIVAAYGTSVLYDVQIIPYSPFSTTRLADETQGNNRVLINDFWSNTDVSGANNNTYFYYNRSGSTSWYAYYPDNIKFDLTIESGRVQKPLNIMINDSYSPTYMDYKIENDCRMWRICSPNFNGAFEFNLAKNGGLNGIDIDITLRPYNPYIHLNPKFNYLYGSEFNDARGLICQGDFSLPLITDQFKNYEVQNKNYQQMFNRQIEHMDFQQGQERVMAGFQLATGTLQGAATGAFAGRVGGAVGAGVGAAVGAVGSLAAGLADYSMMGDRQREDKDYTIESYRMQLGNIKALPYTINKVTPLTNNNKIFPVLELYECTDKEKELFEEYLKYKSMSIDSIGSINMYLQDTPTFISGTLIRLEGTGLANNEIYEIYDELKKGVYI